MRLVLSRSLAAVVVAAFAAPASAQDAAPKTDPWTYDVALYGWMMDLEGDITVRNLTAEADADFNELFDHLEGAVMLHFEAWQADSIGVLGDLNWTRLEQDLEFPGGDGKLEFGMTQLEAAVASRSRHGITHFDFIGGLRWVRFDNDLEAPGGVEESKSRNYLDPMFGFRVGFDVATWLTLSMRLDLAGFGIGTDLTSNFAMSAVVDVADSVAIVGGWRSMALEIDEDRFDLDLRLRGPFLAVDVGF
jgi:hypothetical protein